jgi:glucuronate isomerase
MLHRFDEGIMAAKASAAQMRDSQSNVIAFPQASRLRVAFRCEDTARAAICSHCGGLLAEGESEDECSSIRVFRSS